MEILFIEQKLFVKNSLINVCIHLSFSYNLGSLRVYRSCAAGAHVIIPTVIIHPKMKNIDNTIMKRKEILNKRNFKKSCVIYKLSVQITIKGS